MQKIKDIGGTFDVILVDNDSIPRVECALKALDFLEEGGILLIHDATVGSPCPWFCATEEERVRDDNSIAGELKEEFIPVLKKISPTSLNVCRSLASFKKKSKNFRKEE